MVRVESGIKYRQYPWRGVGDPFPGSRRTSAHPPTPQPRPTPTATRPSAAHPAEPADPAPEPGNLAGQPSVQARSRAQGL